jgi:two-component system, NarL family, nitrate/nitrite response regulator NarL
MITVGAIDDHPVVLQGMSAWLGAVPDIQMTVTAPSVDAYLAAGADAQVVLLDLNLPDHSDPASNVKRLVSVGSKVLVVSVIDDTELILATMEAGADGYLTKNDDLDALVEAIRRVAAGKVAISRELAFAFSRDTRPSRPRLSPQELRVLTAYARGMTLDAAARKAGIKPGTAREYLARIKRKYAEAGRPTYTKLDLAQRLREDRLQDNPDQ